MQTRTLSPWKPILQQGLIGGAIAVLLSLVGIVAAFGQRYIVSGVFTMGQVLFLAPILLMTFSGIRKTSPQPPYVVLLSGALGGLAGGLMLAALVLIGSLINLRAVFIKASPELYAMLTFGQSMAPGLVILLLVTTLAGTVTGGIFLLPQRLRSAVMQAILWVVVVGLLRDLITTMSLRWGPVAILIQQIFALSGLSPAGALLLFVLVGAWRFWRGGRSAPQQERIPGVVRRGGHWLLLAATVIVLLLLPPILGPYFSEILSNVGMYILMGLGLNIVVGFAGLLDLGYVAFFAIGAYTMGVLTSPEVNPNPMTYWEALPFAMAVSVLSGFILGLPVLRLRGDYLAIVTLGFGEIVRLLALSDWLRPRLGGTQGIQLIAQPRLGGFVINTQQELYYLFLVGIGIVAFISWRLRDSRIGRAWMALREDEDVAKAMGINHVTTKLLAFATGALFAGISGTIFAAKLTSVYPHSMNFLVSINVLCLLILGGMGSIPGVFVGALVLIGAPELLREFAEFRYLAYGAVLVYMMLSRPEGLWPEARRRLELHEEEAIAATSISVEAVPASQQIAN